MITNVSNTSLICTLPFYISLFDAFFFNVALKKRKLQIHQTVYDTFQIDAFKSRNRDAFGISVKDKTVLELSRRFSGIPARNL